VLAFTPAIDHPTAQPMDLLVTTTPDAWLQVYIHGGIQVASGRPNGTAIEIVYTPDLTFYRSVRTAHAPWLSLKRFAAAAHDCSEVASSAPHVFMAPAQRVPAQLHLGAGSRTAETAAGSCLLRNCCP
jgi:hypothetical protein